MSKCHRGWRGNDRVRKKSLPLTAILESWKAESFSLNTVFYFLKHLTFIVTQYTFLKRKHSPKKSQKLFFQEITELILPHLNESDNNLVTLPSIFQLHVKSHMIANKFSDVKKNCGVNIVVVVNGRYFYNFKISKCILHCRFIKRYANVKALTELPLYHSLLTHRVSLRFSLSLLWKPEKLSNLNTSIIN